METATGCATTKAPVLHGLALAVTILLVSCLPLKGVADTFDPRSLIDNGGFLVDRSDSSFGYRQHDQFIPASTLKILTSLAAINILGKEYRFTTLFFVDRQENLFIKGSGDPFLTSEAVLHIARELKQRGVVRVNTLFLDDTSFALGNPMLPGVKVPPSSNPYDAPSSGLAVNFNSLPVKKTGTGLISPGEPQTPLLPLMKDAGRTLPKGDFRINIATAPVPGKMSPSLRYAGELFQAQLEKAGITVKRGFGRRQTPPRLNEKGQPLYIYRGQKSLQEIIEQCLKYSNNFIANQLFLAIGMKVYGEPARWDKSRRVMAEFIDKILKTKKGTVRVVDGSGLSRDNKITCATLVAILDRFRPYAHLLPRKRGHLVKSGTLDGVYCYAGYLESKKKLCPFALLLNQEENSRDALLTRLAALVHHE